MSTHDQHTLALFALKPPGSRSITGLPIQPPPSPTYTHPLPFTIRVDLNPLRNFFFSLKKCVYVIDHDKHKIDKRLTLFRLHGSYDLNTLEAMDLA